VPLIMNYVGEPAFKIVFRKPFEKAKPPEGPMWAHMPISAARALQQIGGDAVVKEIGARWLRADGPEFSRTEFRRAAACILGHIRGDFCVERCLDFFKRETDHETKLILGNALLGNSSEDAVDLIWNFLVDIDDKQFEPGGRDLRYHLVAVCTIMGRTFPHFKEWHEAALRDNWGRFGVETGRVADNLKRDDFGPKWSEN